MEFKDRLRQLRDEKNIIASKLASDFDKSESTVRMWETGKSKPDTDTLISLAKYFGCTTDYLLGLSTNRNIVQIKHRNEMLEQISELSNKINDDGELLTSFCEILKRIQRTESFEFSVAISAVSEIAAFLIYVLDSAIEMFEGGDMKDVYLRLVWGYEGVEKALLSLKNEITDAMSKNPKTPNDIKNMLGETPRTLQVDSAAVINEINDLIDYLDVILGSIKAKYGIDADRIEEPIPLGAAIGIQDIIKRCRYVTQHLNRFTLEDGSIVLTDIGIFIGRNQLAQDFS